MRTTVVTTLIVVVLAGVAGWMLLQAQTDAHATRKDAIAKSTTNLGSLLKFHQARAVTHPNPYEGRAWVLAPVLGGDLDLSRRQNLEILFSGRPGAVTEQRLARFDSLAEVMQTPTPDLSPFTDFAGPRRASDCAGDPELGMPVMADGTIEGVVIIAFESGTVQAFDYTELGLPAAGPVVFGAHAPAGLLRCLSDR